MPNDGLRLRLKSYFLILLVLFNSVLESIPKTLNGFSQSQALYLEGQAWLIRTMDVFDPNRNDSKNITSF